MKAQGQSIVDGIAKAELIYSTVPLSFWGGTDPVTGIVIDNHHPLFGKCLQGRILAIPCGRGSCTGSVAMLELLLNGTGPAGIIFQSPEHILSLGVIVSKTLFQKRIPVLLLNDADFKGLQSQKYAAIRGRNLVAGNERVSTPPLTVAESDPLTGKIELTPKDEALLSGAHGEAASAAMKILLEFAKVQEAPRLVDITQAHIDGCGYTGPASLAFVQRFLEMGDARVAVPTSMNSISIDKRRWPEMRVPPIYAKEAGKLADAYTAMGAKGTFTCAPYLLDTQPKFAEDVGWGESNAVVFANSVLGARTQKYPDCIDLCVALTGRAPLAGCHVAKNRLPMIGIKVKQPQQIDDSFYPLLGYHIGELCGSRIPFISGLEFSNPSIADLKAFCAAFATTSSAAMFHMKGVTPEATVAEPTVADLQSIRIEPRDLAPSWTSLNTARDGSVGLIALGNPHLSFEEFETLHKICTGRKRHPSVSFLVTTSREAYRRAQSAQLIEDLEEYGVEVIMDTCWCMLKEPVIEPSGGNIMTNSGKYAHYAPGLVRRNVHFGSLQDCVEAACTGQRETGMPFYLQEINSTIQP